MRCETLTKQFHDLGNLHHPTTLPPSTLRDMMRQIDRIMLGRFLKMEKGQEVVMVRRQLHTAWFEVTF